MLKAYKYRIYPTPEQETFLQKELGLKRLYWNISLANKNADHSYKLTSYKETFSKYKPEALEWCKEIDSTAMADVWNDLTQAFRNFFASCNGTRKGKFMKPPKLKSKKNLKESIGYTAMARPKFVNGKLFITRKLGLLKGAYHCQFFPDTNTVGYFITVRLRYVNRTPRKTVEYEFTD